MTEPHIDPVIAAWLEQRTYGRASLDVAALAKAKNERGLTIAACLPALNEAETVGDICAAISEVLVHQGLIDELVVVDSGSSDETIGTARAAGAKVVEASHVLPQMNSAPFSGKGETLWKSLAVVSSDVVAWLDADTRNFAPHFVADLVAPLVFDDSLVMTKAFYDRPITAEGTLTTGGARVTELMARPLLNMFYPHLTGFIQPLSGEYAVRREAVLDIGFFTEYAVDVGLLIEVVDRFGLYRVGQVDLGARIHRNQDLLALGAMAHQIAQALLMMLEEDAVLKLEADPGTDLVQFERGPGRPSPRTRANAVARRPPMRSVLGSTPDIVEETER